MVVTTRAAASSLTMGRRFLLRSRNSNSSNYSTSSRIATSCFVMMAPASSASFRSDWIAPGITITTATATAMRALSTERSVTPNVFPTQWSQRWAGSLLVSSSLSFSTSAAKPGKKKKSAATTKEPEMGYLAQKRARKERRRELFDQKMQRHERLRTRRHQPPASNEHDTTDAFTTATTTTPPDRQRGIKQAQFRPWFIARKVHDEYMNRKARQAGKEWIHKVAVIVERLPVVMPDWEDWEEDYDQLKAHLNFYNGFDYPPALFPHLIRREDEEDETDEMASLRSTPAITNEDVLERLPKGLVLAPRETEADATGNVRTTDRKLKTSLYLTVQSKTTSQWQFPTVTVREDEGETLLEAAKRAVEETVGTDYQESSSSTLEYWCPSNAPWAVDMVSFTADDPLTSDGRFYGIKTFFVKIQYDEGTVADDAELSQSTVVSDFAWLDRGEIVERVKQEQGDELSKLYHYML